MLTQPATIIKHATLTGGILFQTEGYVTIAQESYEDSKISFTFELPKKTIQLIPKYLSDANYMALTINEEKKLIIGGFVKGAEKTYGQIDIASQLTAQNTLVVTSTDSRFVVSLNGVTVFKFQSALFVKGSVRVTGAADEVFYTCYVEEPQSSAWVSNATSAKIEAKKVELDGYSYMRLTGSSARSATLRERLVVVSDSYALSFSASGEGKVSIKQVDGTILLEETISAAALKSYEVQFTSMNAESIDITFSTTATLTVGKVQFERAVRSSPYIENTSATLPAQRTESTLRLPVKEIFDAESGSIYAKFRTLGPITQLQKLVASDNINFFCAAGENMMYFTMGAAAITMPFTMEAGKDYAIALSWTSNIIRLTVNTTTKTATKKSVVGLSPKEFIFAGEGMVTEGIVLEEFALFNNAISTVADIQKQLPTAQMHGLFDGGISGKNVTWSEIPVAPFDHSPILVQKEDGKTLRKVSFFDYETGDYRTWNEESFIYDGKSDFVEVAYENLNEDFRDIAIRTAEGEKVGEPYRIEGKRFYFFLYDNQKILYKNQELFATYQVNDTYTVDYNINAVDGYRIDFAKHDGKDRIVYQEGNRYGESVKLATMIDMNPIQNQNHEGFLYITNTISKTESFRITATPDRLHADGSSFSTLVIEPLDHQGNFLTHADVEITAELGFVSRHIQKDAVEAQKRSGQYLYQYVAPYIQTEVEGEVVEDTIWIVDKDNKIGVTYKILLSPVKKSTAKRMTKTEKALLTSKTEMINFLLRYEGVEKFEDAALVELLDLDGDGRVTMNEVAVLETKRRDGDLNGILKQVRKWEVK